MEKYIIALDQGTTSSRAIVFDTALRPVAVAQKEFHQHYPRPGWVEHDPVELYASQLGVMSEAMAAAGAGAGQVAAIGIANQRETTVVWDKATGKPVYNAIVWQCRRTADMCDDLAARGWSEKIKEKTGLLIDAYFSATKLAWILDNVPGARARAQAGELLFGTVDTWLIWNLTGGAAHVTDRTNASRTMLYNINTLEWDEEICDLLGIPMVMLPQVKSSGEVYGTANVSGEAVPIAGAAGDQQAALFGQGCFAPGDAKNTYGTGCFLLMNTGANRVESRAGLLTTLAACPAGAPVEYALEGSVFVAGAVVQWLRDEMGLLRTAAESEAVATGVPDTGGVYLVPAFTGLGAPHWDMRARGTIVGLTRGSGRGQLVRAALESIAYQTRDVLSAMERDMGAPLHSLRVDGGAAANNFLMQFQADITGIPVRRPLVAETTALGAAMLAGLGAGVWKTREEAAGAWALDRAFAPAMEEERRAALLGGWHKAVERAKNWGE